MRVGVLGAGVVGSQVVRLLTEQADELAARVGAQLELVAVAVRRPARHPEIPADLLTTDAAGLVARDDIDVVVEVIGGIEPTKDLLLTALRRGAGVVTANKALLAEHGPELYEAADAAGADLYFEAAVAGAIPLIRPLRESLAGDRISRIMGIVNGTTNFILSAMVDTGMGYHEALAEATRLGYAEADPTADVDGFDAAAKAAILASIGFHTRVGRGRRAPRGHRRGVRRRHRRGPPDRLHRQASRDLRAGRSVAGSTARGRRRAGGEGVSARVHPVMLPTSHPLASVDGAFNAVYVEAEAAGRLMFYGPGAGGAPTASAVLGDLVAVARNRIAGGRGPRESAYAALPIQPMGAGAEQVSHQPGRRRQGRRAGRGGHRLRRGRGVDLDGAAGGSGRRRDGLVVVTHSAPDAALAGTSPSWPSWIRSTRSPR